MTNYRVTVTHIDETRPPSQIKKTNLKKDGNKERLPSFKKKNLYPLMKLPSKAHRKVMKRIRLPNKNKEIISMNTKDFLTHSKLPVKSNAKEILHKAPLSPRIQNIATVKSKYTHIRPIFDKFDGIIKSSLEYYKPKPIFFTNNDDFYRKDFRNHHQSDALSLREKVNYIKLHPITNTNVPVKTVMDRLMYLPPSKPVRHRIEYVRNYFYNTEVTNPTQSIKKTVESTTKDEKPYLDPLYYFRRSGWYEDNFEGIMPTTTTTRKPTKRQRRTIFFLSPTIPYNYYL
ncbi:uncharacterized protein [Maniola hyperantus]|uniref:uncharacterized protein n=1 Tax=Aphantopus hyperantus TaxID=2795564 RepID=UPI003748DC03